MLKLQNHSRPGEEHCDACADTGWCLLVTTTTWRGTTYDDGCAPCKWCELGALRYAAARKHAESHKSRRRPLSDYDGSMIVPQLSDAHYVPLPDAECLRRLDMLRQRWRSGATKRQERFSGGGAARRRQSPTNAAASPHNASQAPLKASQRDAAGGEPGGGGA